MRLVHSSVADNHVPSAVGRLPASWSCLLILAALMGVFVLDHLTQDAPLQHLYYLPIIFAALRFGARSGVASSLVAVLLYHLGNTRLLRYQHRESDIIQIALFVAVGVVTAKLADDSRRLHLLAITDDLTGLGNLRAFEAQLGRMVRVSSELHAPLSILVLDLDRLKSLNDKYGHLCGADAVRSVGRIIATSLPRGGIACRYGGDEFAIALPVTSEEAEQYAEKLRKEVGTMVPVLSGNLMPCGTLAVSIGVATKYMGPGEEGEVLFRAADEALYSAKAAGRNRVSIAGITNIPSWNLRG
jgi:diguanylate cyclase (GGDEF)-like protein